MPPLGVIPCEYPTNFTSPETRGIVLLDTENHTIVSFFQAQYWTWRMDRQTDRRNPSGYYSSWHCEQCGCAVIKRPVLCAFVACFIVNCEINKKTWAVQNFARYDSLTIFLARSRKKSRSLSLRARSRSPRFSLATARSRSPRFSLATARSHSEHLATCNIHTCFTWVWGVCHLFVGVAVLADRANHSVWVFGL